MGISYVILGNIWDCGLCIMGYKSCIVGKSYVITTNNSLENLLGFIGTIIPIIPVQIILWIVPQIGIPCRRLCKDTAFDYIYMIIMGCVRYQPELIEYF